ncbi:hypothetical protein NYO67_4591 [Aspergillus flavus]|nr:hypothetical protein NYO67_4591 [Aspergillus flavus]
MSDQKEQSPRGAKRAEYTEPTSSLGGHHEIPESAELTSGAVPSGAVPSGVVPSGVVPSGVVPSGVVPSVEPQPLLQPLRERRLIVLCDGTMKDSTGDQNQAPTNVTRLQNALSTHATMKIDGKDYYIDQISHYQKGVGAGGANPFRAGIMGRGIAANLREAYAFLACNYRQGDKIYLFGFSRGAYTARAIADLITTLGLLSKRGMDNFYKVYKAFFHGEKRVFTDDERLRLGLFCVPRYTIEIVGVWDTVAFNNWSGEKITLYNTYLPVDVKCGYQALALDEKRYPYQPVLWSKIDCAETRDQELLQVWFSGSHSDIGGGRRNDRLSLITLAWMIDQCSKGKKLAFDKGYLIDECLPPAASWATSGGPIRKCCNFGLLYSCKARKPKKNRVDGEITNEELHDSILDRQLSGPGPPGTVHWPCKAICSSSEGYTARAARAPIGLAEIGVLENELKGKVRSWATPPNCAGTCS